jgi:RimJ/RimL family protein N-acetyltransferase
MELFEEFKEDKICYPFIKEYLEQNLDNESINQLHRNKNQSLKKFEGFNQDMSKFILVPFNPFSLEDFKLFKSLVQSEKIMRTTTIFKGNIATDKQAIENFLVKSISQPLFDVGMYNIYIHDAFAGCIGSNVVKVKKNKPVEFSLAVYLKRLFQGKGLAYNASKLIINDILKKYPKAFIWSTTKIGFKPALILNKKIGMIYKGQICKYDDEFLVDYHEYQGNK